MAQPQTATVIVTNPNVYPDLNTSKCRCLGITQITLGVISVVLDVFVMGIYGGSSNGQGFWCGIFMIIAGALGVAGSKSRTKGLVIACGVLSIIACVLSFIALIVSGILAAAAGVLVSWRTAFIGLLIIAVIMVLLFLTEFVVAIVQSVVCLRPACCPTGGAQGIPVATSTTVYTYPAGTQPTQVVNAPQGMQAGYAPQPGYPQPGYPAQQGYPAQPGYAPQPGYPAQPGYPSQQGYASPPSYEMQGKQ